MTGNNVLLDTNIISAWLKGDNGIADKIDRKNGVFIPTIVVGEMHYGAQYSTNVKKNIKNIQKVVTHYEVLYVDTDTTSVYGKIKAELRKKGRPIPENDIWIAAIAMQHGLILITRDNHFSEVEGLSVEKW